MKDNFNLSSVESPSFFLNFPSSFGTQVKNNIWMQDTDEPVDKEVALSQWTDLYNFLSANGVVAIIPTPKNCTLQDLVFVANLGIIINDETVIISNFTSQPRLGETKVGMDYFNLAGYKNVIECPFKFEGEADLKHIRDNIYIGGYGMRSDIKAYEWMEQNFDMKIIKVKMTQDKLYHLDCSIFPLTSNAIMMCKEIYTQQEIEEIEKIVTIVDVPLEQAECGITNNVRIHNLILNSSDLHDLDPIGEKEFYQLERKKNQLLEDICDEYALEVTYVNLSEFMKGGALLSCCVLHANRFSYSVDLL